MKKTTMMNKIGDVIVPVLIYYLIVNAAVLMFGNSLDVVKLTSLCGGLLLIVMWLLYTGDRRKAAVKPASAAWWKYAAAAILGIVSNRVFSSAMSFFAVTEQFSNTAQESLLEGSLLIQVIGIGIIVPVMEEFLFRGLVYQRLKKYLPWQAAALLGAALFALYHGNMIQIIFAFPMGLIIIFLYEKWESLGIPVAFHIASNLSTIILSVVMK